MHHSPGYGLGIPFSSETGHGAPLHGLLPFVVPDARFDRPLAARAAFMDDTRMRGKSDADWKELVASWKARQQELREKRVIAPLRPLPRFVAGADAAFSTDKSTIFAAAVICTVLHRTGGGGTTARRRQA